MNDTAQCESVNHAELQIEQKPYKTPYLEHFGKLTAFTQVTKHTGNPDAANTNHNTI